MKKIILCGINNDYLTDLSDMFHEEYKLAVCEDDPDMLYEMIKILRPDLLVLVLLGTSRINGGDMEAVKTAYPELPIAAVVSVKQSGMYDDILHGENIRTLVYPVDNARILDTAHFFVGVDDERFKKKILVVDDNPMFLRNIRSVLEDDYEVLLAASGLQAMAVIKRKLPDMIFLDYDMPVHDGKETLKMIRGNETSKNIPVVFLSGVTDPESVEAMNSLDVSGYLKKPYSPDDLTACTRKILGC